MYLTDEDLLTIEKALSVGGAELPGAYSLYLRVSRALDRKRFQKGRERCFAAYVAPRHG